MTCSSWPLHCGGSTLICAQRDLGDLDRANELDEQARALMLEAEKLRAGLQHKQVAFLSFLQCSSMCGAHLQVR